MHYYGSYPGYSSSQKMPKAKSADGKNYPKQITSNPTVYHPHFSPKNFSSGGCGCGSKLPKR